MTIYKAVAVYRHWYLENGQPATCEQADAIAMGLIKGKSETTEEQIWITSAKNLQQARRAFSRWCRDSDTYHRKHFLAEEIKLVG